MKNIDKVRNMSTKELSRYLLFLLALFYQNKCPKNAVCSYKKTCEECWAEWLNQEEE